MVLFVTNTISSQSLIDNFDTLLLLYGSYLNHQYKRLRTNNRVAAAVLGFFVTIGMKIFSVFILLCAISGCDIPGKGVLETTPPPFIEQATSSPSIIDVNHLAVQPTDPIDTLLSFLATVGGRDPSTIVTYTFLDPSGDVLSTGTLSDDGISPDHTAGDGKFAASLSFHILKQDIGRYSIQFQAKNSDGATSNMLLQLLTVKNSNNHPPHISNLIMQDTVAVPPPGDTSFVKITLAVSDTEGLGDISSVTLSSTNSKGGSAGQFNLYDDGGSILYLQFGLPFPSSDAVVNDGIFTILIPLTKPAETLPYYRDFSFRATDRTGDSSNIITKRIFIVQ